jgi:cytochrome oxidase Cu insertion factor (SCO1/SenC/PrrC family)
MNGKAVFFVAAATAVIAALVYSSMFNQATRGSIKAGKPAPEIVGEDVDGKPMKLSDFRGTVVLLDFWGNW